MSKDSEGSVPLWEAMLANHKPVVKLLSENGAKLTGGDIGFFACIAAEQNNLELLKEIVSQGGDVTRPKSNGSTSLHVAVCEGNIEIVKFLMDQGANINTGDENGWTPSAFAEQQGHEDIKELFDSYRGTNTELVRAVTAPEERHGVRFLGRFKSEPTILPVDQDTSFPPSDGLWGRPRPTRRRTNNFYNSLFGIMSAAQTGESNSVVTTVDNASKACASRVTVSCPEKGDPAGKLVLLPSSFQELLEIGAKKYGFLPAKILSKSGAAIEEIELIRDGDHLVFVSDNRD